jgi:hypothetical protein
MLVDVYGGWVGCRLEDSEKKGSKNSDDVGRKDVAEIVQRHSHGYTYVTRRSNLVALSKR